MVHFGVEWAVFTVIIASLAATLACILFDVSDGGVALRVAVEHRCHR